MSKPCEYCGEDLPEGVDKHTRQTRSAHFAHCAVRLAKVESAKSQPEPEPEHEHNWQFQGNVYKHEGDVPGSGAQWRYLYDRFFCTKCLEQRDVSPRCIGNSYHNPPEGPVPA